MTEHNLILFSYVSILIPAIGAIVYLRKNMNYDIKVFTALIAISFIVDNLSKLIGEINLLYPVYDIIELILLLIFLFPDSRKEKYIIAGGIVLFVMGWILYPAASDTFISIISYSTLFSFTLWRLYFYLRMAVFGDVFTYQFFIYVGVSIYTMVGLLAYTLLKSHPEVFTNLFSVSNILMNILFGGATWKIRCIFISQQ